MYLSKQEVGQAEDSALLLQIFESLGHKVSFLHMDKQKKKKARDQKTKKRDNTLRNFALF